MEYVSLRNELERHRGKTVMLGMRSSFFYVGPCEEAIKDIGSIGMASRFCLASNMKKDLLKFVTTYPEDDGIGEMRVVKTYTRNSEDGDGDVVVIVSGREFGQFWTRSEYLESKKAMMSKMAEAISLNMPVECAVRQEAEAKGAQAPAPTCPLTSF